MLTTYTLLPCLQYVAIYCRTFQDSQLRGSQMRKCRSISNDVISHWPTYIPWYHLLRSALRIDALWSLLLWESEYDLLLVKEVYRICIKFHKMLSAAICPASPINMYFSVVSLNYPTGARCLVKKFSPCVHPAFSWFSNFELFSLIAIKNTDKRTNRRRFPYQCDSAETSQM